MEYIINGENENGEKIIEKRGHVITFTLNDVVVHKDKMAKMLKEASATKMILDAKAQNVINNHPEVKDMTPEQLHTVWFYYEQVQNAEKYEKKMQEIEAIIKEYDDELAEIEKQTGVKTLSVESPIENEQGN